MFFESRKNDICLVNNIKCCIDGKNKFRDIRINNIRYP